MPPFLTVGAVHMICNLFQILCLDISNQVSSYSRNRGIKTHQYTATIFDIIYIMRRNGKSNKALFQALIRLLSQLIPRNLFHHNKLAIICN